MFSLFKKRKDTKREAIMATIRKATEQGQCVILADTPEGCRIIVLGKDTMTRQLEEITKRKGVEL